MGSAVTTGFPIGDAHGNMATTLSRSGTGFAVNDRRSCDAWGNLRSSQATGDPKQRHCANLGHPTDDETSLVYMRARYYDPTSGRFISQDPSMEGSNWYVYCGNDPVNSFDITGKTRVKPEAQKTFDFLFYGAVGCFAVAGFTIDRVGVGPAVAVFSVGIFLGALAFGSCTEVGTFTQVFMAMPGLVTAATADLLAYNKIDKTLTGAIAGGAALAETGILIGLLVSFQNDTELP